MTKKASNKIDVKAIEDKIVTHIKNVEDMKNEYKANYEKMKDIEKSITVEAGAIAALRSLIIVSEPTAKDDGGDK